MKFEDFINKEAVERTAGIIEKDCKPYLKLIRGKIPLYRGSGTEDKKRITEFLLMGKTRPKRTSKGLDSRIFKEFNRWLEEAGHVRKDKNVIIATSSVENAEPWGILGYIFPIGKLNYTFIRSYDVNIQDNRTGWPGRTLLSQLFDVKSEYFWKSSGISPNFDNYFSTNKNFNEAYNKGYEMWFKCDKYYFITYEKSTEEARNRMAIFDKLGLKYG